MTSLASRYAPDEENKAPARLYKIRLPSGRVLGPFDLDRIKLFILKDQINGSEVARDYPSGSWKDINQFPEIAELILLHLQGRLQLLGAESKGVEDPEPSDPITKATSEVESSVPSRDEEGTMVMTRDSEGTLVGPLVPENSEEALALVEESSTGQDTPLVLSTAAEDVPVEDLPQPEIARERTILLRIPTKDSGSGLKEGTTQQSTTLLARLFANRAFKLGFALVAGMVLASQLYEPEPKKKKNADLPFSIEVPNPAGVAPDPQKSDRFFKEGLSFYNLDTVDGYKRAAYHFKQAVIFNTNNVPAIGLLASCYMNLVDVVKKDESFFQVVSSLIDAARVKNPDLMTTVLVDVEFFNLLTNHDAALDRIMDYSKVKLRTSGDLGAELFYYQALSLYLKGSAQEALKYLERIPENAWFSVRIPYLFGLIYENAGQAEEAVQFYEKALQKSPDHIRARVHLAEVLLKKDNFAGAGKHAEFVTAHPEFAAQKELARAYYIQSRTFTIVNRLNEALASIQKSIRLTPEDPDFMYEYYSLRARMGSVGAETQKQIRVYDLMARGEDALRRGQLSEALTLFLDARKEDDQSTAPLLRIAEVFKRQGEIFNAKVNYEKAMRKRPDDQDLYPGYIKLLVEAFEFKEARAVLDRFMKLAPSPSPQLLDYLNGLFYLKQDRLREATAFFRRALQSGSFVDSAVYNRFADILLKSEVYKDAAFYYTLALRFEPNNIHAISGIARTIMETDGLDKAIAYLQSTMQHMSAKSALLTLMAEMYLQKGNLEQAHRIADTVLQEDAQFPAALKVKAEAYQAQEKFKEALDYYQSYSVVVPADPLVHVDKYKIYMKRADLGSARREMSQVLSRYPSYPGGHHLMGEIEYRAQEPQKALLEAQLELKANEGYVPGMVLAGNSLVALARMAKASEARSFLAKALDYLNGAMKLAPDYIPGLIAAGTCHHLLKNYAAAQTILERALKLDAGNPDIRRSLGYLYWEMGNRGLARQHLKAYLDVLPEAGDRREIEAMLKN